MFEESFTGTQLAHAVCDKLVEKGKLKIKPAFIRTDREAKIAGYFEAGKLDGAKMGTFDNPGAVEMVVRRITTSEPWVDDVVDCLISMLPESAAKAKKVMGMDEETKAAFEEAQDRTAQRRDRLEQQKESGGNDDRGGGRRERDNDRETRETDRAGRWGDKGYGGSRDDDRRDRGGDRWGPSDGGDREKGKGAGGKGGKERNREIEDALEEALADHEGPVQVGDFDGAARRFLTELRARDRQDNGSRFKEGMDMVFQYTSSKDRAAVRKWSAYVYTLLQKFDPAIADEMREKEQERRSLGQKGGGKGGRSQMQEQESED